MSPTAAQELLLMGARRGLASLRQGQLGYWPLQDASGADVASNNTLSLVNTPTAVAGPGAKLPRATQFTAASSQVMSIADNVPLTILDHDFAACVWVYPDSLASSVGLMSKYNGVGTEREWFIRTNSATTRFQAFIRNSSDVEDGVSADTFGNISTSTWYFVEVAYDAAADLFKIAVNGGAFDAVSHATGCKDSSAAFVFGGQSDPLNYFSGRLAGGGFWNRQLSVTERAFLYNGGRPRAFPFSS